MPLTFGLTGMDPTTESELKTAFASANTRLGNRWQLLPDAQAAYVIVDMDSMYGPMSWLRLHAAGKQVIGLTTAARTQADFRLASPFDADAMADLLQALAEHAGESLDSNAAAPTSASTPAPAPASTPAPAGLTPAPQPQDQLPEELPGVAEEATPISTPNVSAQPASAAAGSLIPELAASQATAAEVAVSPSVPASSDTVPPAPIATGDAAPSTLAEWISSGKLEGRMRYQRDASHLLIDNGARQYYAGATLKPLAPLFQGAASKADFAPINDADWAKAIASLGEPQPLLRLVWFGALIAGEGKLVAGFDPDGRFQMIKWPQTEREYPKHFRIATAMMKGPATIAEVAEASGVPAPDVTDFVNASLATGFADAYREPEPEPEPTRSGGLFGRLRGR